MVRSGPFGRQAKSVPQKIHPTRQKLIETALQLLEVCSPADITADLILDASGVSKGSLYHHFEDLTDVIEAAMIVRFAVGVNESVKSLADIVSSAKSREELMQGLEAVARSAHVQERMRLRATRIQMISLTLAICQIAAGLQGGGASFARLKRKNPDTSYVTLSRSS